MNLVSEMDKSTVNCPERAVPRPRSLTAGIGSSSHLDPERQKMNDGQSQWNVMMMCSLRKSEFLEPNNC